MTRNVILVLSCVLFFSAGCQSVGNFDAHATGWQILFDGSSESFNNWKASEHKDTFSLRDGMMVAKGPRSHLFYAGPVENAEFKNFELKMDVKTKPNSNSGIYFHTSYQETGWPAKGYEVQVNNTHKDVKKTGGLYGIVDVLNNSPVKDNKWFTVQITVIDKHIVVKVNGKTTVDYFEPKDYKHPRWAGRKISTGTFALQGHDPGSTVYFKNIMVKPLAP